MHSLTSWHPCEVMVKPLSHSQWNVPGLLVQLWSQPPFPTRHSSTSLQVLLASSLKPEWHSHTGLFPGPLKHLVPIYYCLQLLDISKTMENGGVMCQKMVRDLFLFVFRRKAINNFIFSRTFYFLPPAFSSPLAFLRLLPMLTSILEYHILFLYSWTL